MAKKTPCPHCGIGMLTKSGQGTDFFTCGTTIVDGELRLGPNCGSYVANKAESVRLKAEIEKIKETNGL